MPRACRRLQFYPPYVLRQNPTTKDMELWRQPHSATFLGVFKNLPSARTRHRHRKV
jgi:hypothetical protein